jgi:hypothetical protein
MVLISPVPRYVYTKCCDNFEHIENFEDPELDEEIVLGLEGVIKIMQNWAFEHMTCVLKLLIPLSLAESCDLGLRKRVTSTGHRLWRKDDPVHLTTEAYQDIALAVRDTVVSGPAEDSASAAGSVGDR